MADDEKKRIDSAYHESGHCLCYVLDKREIKYVTIKHENDFGRTEGEKGSYFRKESFKKGLLIALYKASIMLVSGGLSELIYYNSEITDFTNPEWNKILGWSDYIKADDLGLTSCLNYARIPAENRLRKYWYAVTALTPVLLEKDYLPGKEAYSIIDTVIKEHRKKLDLFS